MELTKDINLNNKIYKDKKNIFTYILSMSGFILFLLSIPIKSAADSYYYLNGTYPSYSILRHVLFTMSILFFGLAFFNIKKRYKFGNKIMYGMLFLVFLIMIISFFQAFKMQVIPIYTMKSIYFFVSPIILSYFIINVLEGNILDKGMKIAFILIAIQYIYSRWNIFLTFSSFLEINFFDSFSPFESSTYAGYFYGFMIYFLLCSKSKKFGIMAFIFNFLVFKRINIIFSVFFLALFWKKEEIRKINVPKIVLNVLVCLFSIIPIIEYNIITSQEKLYKLALYLGFTDTKGLVMGRDYFINSIVNSGFKSSGFGSTGILLEQILGKKGIEMDAIQIYLELGILGCFLFAFFLWKSIPNNVSAILVMFLFYINICTAYQITESYTVFFTFLVLFIIEKEYREEQISEKSQL